MKSGFNQERFSKTQEGRRKVHEEQGIELFRLQEDWGALVKRFREIFAENLLDLATDPDAPLLDYLIGKAEKVQRGEKIESETNSDQTLVRLAQDGRLSHEQIDRLREEFFTNPRKRLADEDKNETE